MFTLLTLLTACVIALPSPRAIAQVTPHELVMRSNGPNAPIDLTPFLLRLNQDIAVTSPGVLSDLPADIFSPLYDTPGGGYTTRPVWYRLHFKVLPGHYGDISASFLELGPTYLNQIRLWVISRETGAIVWSDVIGDRIPNKTGTPSSLLHLSQWPSLPPGDYHLVLGVKTNSAQILSGHLLPEADIIARASNAGFIPGLYLGVLLVGFAIFLTFGIQTKDRAVVWYGGYVFSLFLLNLGISGYAHLLLTDLWDRASDFVTGIGSAFSVGTSIAMWAYIIQINRYNMPLFRVIMVFSLLAMACGLTATTDAYILFIRSFFLSDIVLLLILLGYLIYIGYRESWLGASAFYLVALGIPTIAAITHMLMLLGYLPANDFTLSFYPASTVFHLILVGIAMAYRTRKKSHQWIDAYQHDARANQLAGEQRDFITMLSHEFRTPLAIIQRSAEIVGLLLRHEPDAIHNRLATIRSNARQLSSLVDVFLTKETLDNANFFTAPEPVAIDVFLKTLITRRNREVPDHEVKLQHVDHAVIEMDRTLFEQAILNLIENARKYAPMAPVRIACERSSNGYVYIRIIDDGPGISPDDLERVTDAFYRGDASGNTQGVGLGLHITNRIIQAHQGSMSLSVGEHGGTTVLIHVPYDQTRTRTRNRGLLSPPPPAQGRTASPAAITTEGK